MQSGLLLSGLFPTLKAHVKGHVRQPCPLSFCEAFRLVHAFYFIGADGASLCNSDQGPGRNRHGFFVRLLTSPSSSLTSITRHHQSIGSHRFQIISGGCSLTAVERDRELIMRVL
ncbi:hypothetical protein NL676_009546 [Syzygium grande]|nr:hypothetical protein NL676_009546 [Syzygium grande]